MVTVHPTYDELQKAQNDALIILLQKSSELWHDTEGLIGWRKLRNVVNAFNKRYGVV